MRGSRDEFDDKRRKARIIALHHQQHDRSLACYLVELGAVVAVLDRSRLIRELCREANSKTNMISDDGETIADKIRLKVLASVVAKRS